VIRVWLIRHGESESNAGLPSQEAGSSPLTALGRWQAEQVAAAFAEPPALIVTSPYVRARETAEPSVSRFPAAAVEEWPVQEFTYLGDLGERALTSLERRPFVRAYWERADPQESRGGAESFAGLIARGREFLDRLTAEARGPVAVFTHGIFMRAVAWSLVTGVTVPGPDDMRAFRRFAGGYYTPNGGVVELRARPGRPAPALIGGSTLHLPPAPAPAPVPEPAAAPPGPRPPAA
jgi:broad specificity phosphatase PhoE